VNINHQSERQVGSQIVIEPKFGVRFVLNSQTVLHRHKDEIDHQGGAEQIGGADVAEGKHRRFYEDAQFEEIEGRLVKGKKRDREGQAIADDPKHCKS